MKNHNLLVIVLSLGLQSCSGSYSVPNQQLDYLGVQTGEVLLRNQEMIQNNTLVDPLLNGQSRITKSQRGFYVK